MALGTLLQHLVQASWCSCQLQRPSKQSSHDKLPPQVHNKLLATVTCHTFSVQQQLLLSEGNHTACSNFWPTAKMLPNFKATKQMHATLAYCQDTAQFQGP
jgi:hypothetical protein